MKRVSRTNRSRSRRNLSRGTVRSSRLRLAATILRRSSHCTPPHGTGGPVATAAIVATLRNRRNCTPVFLAAKRSTRLTSRHAMCIRYRFESENTRSDFVSGETVYPVHRRWINRATTAFLIDNNHFVTKPRRKVLTAVYCALYSGWRFKCLTFWLLHFVIVEIESISIINLYLLKIRLLFLLLPIVKKLLSVIIQAVKIFTIIQAPWSEGHKVIVRPPVLSTRRNRNWF